MGRKLFLTGPERRGGDDIYRLVVDDDDEGPQALRLTICAGMLHIKANDTELKVPLPDPDDELVDEVFDRAVEALPNEVELYTTHYTEKLSSEHIQKLFAGNDDGVYEEVYDDDGYREAITSACWNVVEQTVDEADLDLLKQSKHDKIGELFNVLDERDSSDPVGDMARFTGKQFVRYRLGEIELTTMDDADTAATEIADLLGLEPNGPFRSDIDLILANADTAWSPRGLWLLFYGDVEELIEACRDNTELNLAVTKPEVVLYGAVEGGGWAEQLDTTITVPFDRARLQLDAKGIGNGRSWTEEISAGGATDATISFTPRSN